MQDIIQIIIWSCISIAVLIGIGAIILWSISAKNMRAQRQRMLKLQEDIKVGAQILCANGIYGKITAIQDDKLYVEIASHCIITISRYAVQEVI